MAGTVHIMGERFEPGDLIHLPVGAEDDDQRISLLVAAKVLERHEEQS